MDVSRQTLLAGLNAALDWWRDAGVDCVFDDVPRQWIAARQPPDQATAQVDAVGVPPPAASPPPQAPPRAVIGGDRAGWPREFSEFADWWLTEPALDNGRLQGRVPPRGPVAPSLMILVPQPEADDRDTLLSGRQGGLLTAMLSAMGLSDEQVYVASALPRHTPMADWRDLAAQGLGEVVREHLALVRPKGVIAFGRHVSSLLAPFGLVPPLPGHVPTQKMPVFLEINHEGRSMPLLVAHDLGALLERPIAKRQFWQHWLAWSAG